MATLTNSVTGQTVELEESQVEWFLGETEDFVRMDADFIIHDESAPVEPEADHG